MGADGRKQWPELFCHDDQTAQMSRRSIPEDVERFIGTHIQSVELLEVLLFLRAHCEDEWSPEQICATLRTSLFSSSTKLAELDALRLASSRQTTDGGMLYRYAPPAAEDEAIGTLAQYYASHSVRIIELIYSRPQDSVRNFARAFRLRKDDDE